MTAENPPEPSGAPASRFGTRSSWFSWLILAVLAYAPAFTSQPGLVAADTKQYLYLDPGRLTQGAASMWDPDVGLGTVTHQNIGYLFPMGPWYWAVHALGVPMWIGQRLWMGSLLLAAGTGVLWCSRHLGLGGPGRLVAAVAYTATPFIIDYIARISAILMPWAALGWMLGLVILAIRRGGWRYPALLALVVALVGGVNATSILLVGMAPLIWVAYALWVTREAGAGQVWAAVWRMSLLSTVVSLWWIAGLWAEGSYGIAILQYTETVPTVARTSLASEALRGLGYWFFYGQDKVQPWTTAALPYMQALWLLAVSFCVPALCMLMGLFARWRYRAYAVLLVLVGTTAAVGTYPYGQPSPVGTVLKAASAGSSIGLAMRSSNRVVPLVVFGLALLLGSGVSALAMSRPRLGVAVALAAGALILADMPPLWSGGLVAANLARPSAVPGYWTRAASYLDARGDSTRVLGLPGEDFAAYRWGVTEDPVAPGLLTRPYVGRQVVPQGEPAGVDLLQALDGSVQDGVFDPSGLAPVARLISAGDVILQSDLQYERYALPQPRTLWRLFHPLPTGITSGPVFGPPAPTPPIKFPLVDETSLALPNRTPYPPALAVLQVPGARPLTRAESSAEPLVLAGSGQGILYAADAGLLDANPTIFYSASLDSDPAGFARLMYDGADLVLSDTNAKQGHRWGGLQDNLGYVEQPNETPLEVDPSDARLPVFPRESSDATTTADLIGVRSVRATRYGNPVSFTPEDRPSNAFDGNTATAWTVDAFSEAVGERLEVRLDHPVTTNLIALLQPQGGARNRHITKVALSFDGSRPLTEDLTAASLSGTGQVIHFPGRSFHTLSITIAGTNRNGGRQDDLDGLAGVGFAEVGIPGVNLEEVVDMPGDLLRLAGTASASHRLVILMDRVRAPDTPPRTDPQLDLVRRFSLPTARTFSVGGQARISAKDADALIDADIGGPGSATPKSLPGQPARDPVLTANSSTRLPGDRYARADAAVDGDPNTAWSAALAKQDGEWLQYGLARPLTFDHLDMQIVNDGRHSLPTRLTVSAGRQSRRVDLPALAVGKGRPQGATSTVHVAFPALTGTQVRITLDSVHRLTSLDYYGGFSGYQDVLPVALAEVGLPRVTAGPAPAFIPPTCRTDLVTVDGAPLDVRVTGSSADALAGKPLAIRPCGNAAHGWALGAGPHLVRTSPRLPSGFEIDQLWMASDSNGAPLGATATGGLPSPSPGPGSAALLPALRVTHQNRTQETVSVKGKGSGYWLVLGQSLSSGWKATITPARGRGPSRSLGQPQLIDGYADGWYVPAADARGASTVQLSWTPQRVIWLALVLSGAAVLACLALVLETARRRRPATPRGSSVEPVPLLTAGFPVPILRSPLDFGGRRPDLLVCLPVATGAGVAAGALSAPWAAPVIGFLVLLGLLRGRARVLLGGGAVAMVLAAAGYMVDQQWYHRFLSDISWPSNFGLANTLGWGAVLLLAADALVEAIRNRDEARHEVRNETPSPSEVHRAP